MKKIMISQPMRGKTEEEILSQKAKAEKTCKELGYEIENTFFNDEWAKKDKLSESGIVQIPVHFLSLSIRHMALCDAVYFCKGWENYRGCKIEHDVAVAYGLRVIYETDED